jgi:hypothetical protein
VADYKAKTGHVPVFIEPQTVFGMAMVADALKRTKPEGGALNVNAFAKALEATKIKTPMGEMSMRAADHQALLPMVVSTVTKDAKFKADDTDMGFKPVKRFTARRKPPRPRRPAARCSARLSRRFPLNFHPSRRDASVAAQLRLEQNLWTRSSFPS